MFHRISGTTAISGAVDSSFTLVEEKRGSGRARLTCVGRDIEYRELELRRSEENLYPVTELTIISQLIFFTDFSETRACLKKGGDCAKATK